MIKALIFDMDGVIIDSEPLWEKAERILLNRKGIEYDHNYRDKIMGLNQDDSARVLKETFNLKEPIETIISERIDILLRIYEEYLELVPGFLKLLKKLTHHNFLLALASSSPKIVIDYVLNKFSLYEYFQVVVSGDSVEHGKPFPDIYLLASDKLGIKPNESVVIEDSINGLNASKRAGMFCIVLPDKSLNKNDYHEADLIINSLDNIRIKTLTEFG